MVHWFGFAMVLLVLAAILGVMWLALFTFGGRVNGGDDRDYDQRMGGEDEREEDDKIEWK